ncbi:MAG TPA: ABC transporter ATP-binding protein [Saprospiraceae bacterium]|nr:ABC transporter ATP-binding protein [Saprospiraceae bacterium]HPN69332.1 ABC transporter ATP-binding protein [Saprospiraceae bacterium]
MNEKIDSGDLPLLSVNNLVISFAHEDGIKRVIDQVNFELYKGEILGIVGESGSGKTLSCLAIMQLLPPGAIIASGQILFRDDTITDLLQSSEEKLQTIRGNRISMVFQEPMSALNPSHRCGKQVAEIISLHHPEKSTAQIKAEVLALFQKVKLPDVERIYKSYIHQLSGGQLQRVMIAMAIANKPAVIIADEPTTALDVTVQESILDLLLALKDDFNCSIIFISHDLGVIKKIANRIVVMQKGIVVEEGLTKNVFENAQHLYTKALIACRPPLDYRLSRLPIVQDFINVPESEHAQITQHLKVSDETFHARLTSLQKADVLLDVQNLSKYYPAQKSFWGKALSYTKAVDEVSFTMKKGETLGLVGESGCGKSTLGRAILRLITPTAGKVIFEEKDVFAFSNSEMRKMRKHMQIIFQDPYSSLNPRMKIGEAIKEPMIIHNMYESNEVRTEKVMALLDVVGLSRDHYNRYPHQFSGGQRQRINIARTLSLNPKFIVCDESVSALDVSVQAQVLNLLMDLKAQFDLTYLFISHDISVVKHISDNIMVMEKGKIVEKGNSEEVYHHPQNQYTRRLIDAVPK